MSLVETITITEAADGQRLERWLKKHYPAATGSQFHKLCRTGQIRVDGKRVKADYRLKTGETLRLPPALSGLKTVQDKTKNRNRAKDRDTIRAMTVYEDKDILILNKPHGLASQGGTGQRESLDLIARALEKNGEEPRIVHRMDKDTSGLIVLARTAKAARALGQVFKSGEGQKHYLAITCPTPEQEDGSIIAPLAKGQAGKNLERMLHDEENGKYAKTEFQMLDKAHTTAALLAFWPRTGRTHQIRAHALLAGFPLLADRKYDGYFDEDTPRKDQKLCLHAFRLSFRHPLTGKTVDAEAPLPEHFKKAMDHYGLSLRKKVRLFEDLD